MDAILLIYNGTMGVNWYSASTQKMLPAKQLFERRLRSPSFFFYHGEKFGVNVRVRCDMCKRGGH